MVRSEQDAELELELHARAKHARHIVELRIQAERNTLMLFAMATHAHAHDSAYLDDELLVEELEDEGEVRMLVC